MSIVSELWIIDVWISMHTCCNRSFWLLLKSIRFNKLQTIAFSISESYNSFLFIALCMQQCYNVFVQIVLEREMNARNNKKNNQMKRMSILFYFCFFVIIEENNNQCVCVYFTFDCFIFFWCLLFNILCHMFHTKKKIETKTSEFFMPL